MASNETFDESTLAEFVSEALDFRAASESFSVRGQLKKADLQTLRLLTSHGRRLVPTVGGLLLFGRQLDRRFPGAWIQCGRFKGTNKSEIPDSAGHDEQDLPSSEQSRRWIDESASPIFRPAETDVRAGGSESVAFSLPRVARARERLLSKRYCQSAEVGERDSPPQPLCLLGFRLVYMKTLIAVLCPLSLAIGLSLASGAAAPAFSVQLDTISSGFDHKTCWVHPRAGAIPGPTPSVVLTMQRVLLTGSDVFYAINEMRTDNLGKSWSEPHDHADTLGRRTVAGDVSEGVADFWPKWHAKSGRLLGIGLMARYQGDAQVPNFPRKTAYSVYDATTRTWTPWDTMAMPNAAKFFSAGAGCAQRVDLPNGDILLPIYFRAQDSRTYTVTVLRCSFDGRTLRVTAVGNDLTVTGDRGLYEPSLTLFQNRYYLTIRADRAGYVATSDDGLNFTPPKAWTWDSGEDLGNYNTQQHWVTHDRALYLVYTRRGANNDHVMRNRAPLFIAQVDPEKLQVIRATEQILVPERGARLGNFGITEVNENETWVTVAEWMQTKAPNPYDYTIPMKYGSNNAVFVARIRWQTPNSSWNKH